MPTSPNARVMMANDGSPFIEWKAPSRIAQMLKPKVRQENMVKNSFANMIFTP